MFAQTAYEAMYQYLGLELHAKFIEVITSEKVLLATVLLVFGFMFFHTSVQFFSRYMPGALIARKSVPLSRYVKITALLFLSLALLNVGTEQGVRQYNGESWHTNPYIKGHIRTPVPSHRVSFVFDLLSRSAEEVAALIARVVDRLFQTTHSNLKAPNFFYKAIMFGASDTIEDTDLKQRIRFYTEECFDRMLPLIGNPGGIGSRIDAFFGEHSPLDAQLAELPIVTEDRSPYTCGDLKNEVGGRLKEYARSRTDWFGRALSRVSDEAKLGPLNLQAFTNQYLSQVLVNEYTSEHEAYLGVQKGSQLPGTAGRILQYFRRIGFDGLMGFLGGGEFMGAWVAAERSQEFSENLARAPHVAGFIKMLLIAIFPWLLFLVVAGRWKVLLTWWVVYFSVLLWTPIWTLLYHIMTSIALSAETLEAFGRLNDQVSLYSAQLISHRIYHLFAVYSWLQLLTGTAFTGMMLFFLRPALSDTESDAAPEAVPTVIEGASRAASAGSKAFGGAV